MKNDIAVIGLSVMGGNLAMNIADKGFKVAVFNRSPEKTKALMQQYGGQNMDAYFDLRSMVESLAVPRKIILMVQAGEAVDEVISQLQPLLEKGDIIVDGGNSYFKDTLRRENDLAKKGTNFVGMGISGGEEGARKGPSLMPGGSKESYASLENILLTIAAKDFHGAPCATHIGSGGAGHFVKMVHNGIEYIDMQLIAETYWILKNIFKMDNESIADKFDQWNEGRLNSFLIEISARVVKAKYADGSYVVDSILDSAGSKGTGKWTSQEVLDLGSQGFGFVSAVLARYASSQKQSRLERAEAYGISESKATSRINLDDLEKALYVSKILAYSQGYELLKEASGNYGWDLDFKNISRIWQGGCIIRAAFLLDLEKAYLDQPKMKSILLSEKFLKIIKEEMPALRLVASEAVLSGVPIPAMLSGIAYFDSVTSSKLPANLIQAQRDYFGAHTFQTEIGGPFVHHDWQS